MHFSNQIKSAFIRNDSTQTPQQILNSTMHKKDENCESTKTIRRQQKSPYGLRVSCPLEADIRQKQTVKTAHEDLYKAKAS